MNFMSKITFTYQWNSSRWAFNSVNSCRESYTKKVKKKKKKCRQYTTSTTYVRRTLLVYTRVANVVHRVFDCCCRNARCKIQLVTVWVGWWNLDVRCRKQQAREQNRLNGNFFIEEKVVQKSMRFKLFKVDISVVNFFIFQLVFTNFELYPGFFFFFFYQSREVTRA